MRRLTLHTLLSFAVALVPFAIAAQAPNDSMYVLPWVRDSIGFWHHDDAVWCITRHADLGSLFVIAGVRRAEPAVRDGPVPCTAADGSLYPVLLDMPECPTQPLRPRIHPFMLVRCEENSWLRFQSKRVEPKT